MVLDGDGLLIVEVCLQELAQHPILKIGIKEKAAPMTTKLQSFIMKP